MNRERVDGPLSSCSTTIYTEGRGRVSLHLLVEDGIRSDRRRVGRGTKGVVKICKVSEFCKRHLKLFNYSLKMSL